MKTLGLILTLSLINFSLLAKVTTCDMPAENAIVTIDETSTPIQLKTEYPALGAIFTEEIAGVSLRQIQIVDNGQVVFIDALVYQTAFSSDVAIFEYNGDLRGYYGLYPGSPLDLVNCSIN